MAARPTPVVTLAPIDVSRKRKRETPKSTRSSRARTPKGAGTPRGNVESNEDAAKREAEERNKRMTAMLEMMTPAQLNRYEKCRRSKFKKDTVERLIKGSLEQIHGSATKRNGASWWVKSGKSAKLPEDAVILMAGSAKVLVREIIELGASKRARLRSELA
jgi:hypothetical protein